MPRAGIVTSCRRESHGVMTVAIYGAVAVSLTMVMHTLERGDRRFIIGLAAGCRPSSAHGLLSGAWPFGIVELFWSGMVLRRSQTGRAA